MRFLAAVIATGLLVVAVACTTDETGDTATDPPSSGEVEATPVPTDTPPPATSDILNLSIGEVAKVGDAEVTALGFRNDPGGEFLAPDAGNVWIVVEVTVTNTGDDEYNISSILQMAVRDSEGREYDISIGPDTNGSLDGTILAGDFLRGEAGFEVPAAATGLQYVFKQSFGSEQARWNLQ